MCESVKRDETLEIQGTGKYHQALERCESEEIWRKGISMPTEDWPVARMYMLPRARNLCRGPGEGAAACLKQEGTGFRLTHGRPRVAPSSDIASLSSWQAYLGNTPDVLEGSPTYTCSLFTTPAP